MEPESLVWRSLRLMSARYMHEKETTRYEEESAKIKE